MKVIIAGSRHIEQWQPVWQAITDSGFRITEVVSGCASGVDTHGLRWAEDRGVPFTPFPAAWGDHGRAAGPMRNARMAEYADALIAVWDGKSRGTADMIQKAAAKPMPMFVRTVQ